MFPISQNSNKVRSVPAPVEAEQMEGLEVCFPSEPIRIGIPDIQSKPAPEKDKK